MKNIEKFLAKNNNVDLLVHRSKSGKYNAMIYTDGFSGIVHIQYKANSLKDAIAGLDKLVSQNHNLDCWE